jgi:hypothetical protein
MFGLAMGIRGRPGPAPVVVLAVAALLGAATLVAATPAAAECGPWASERCAETDGLQGQSRAEVSWLHVGDSALDALETMELPWIIKMFIGLGRELAQEFITPQIGDGDQKPVHGSRKVSDSERMCQKVGDGGWVFIYDRWIDCGRAHDAPLWFGERRD